MKGITFKTIKGRLSFWFLLLSLFPLIIALTIVYFQRVDAIETATISKLTAIRDLKVSRLNDWLLERRGDMMIIASDRELSAIESVINQTASEKSHNLIIDDCRFLISNYLKNFPAYSEIFILNPVNGKVLVSTTQSFEGEERSSENYFTKPLETKSLFIKGVYYSKSVSDLSMVYSIPIFNRERDKNNVIGILVARIDLHNTLYEMLLDRVGLGETGETLIVNDEIFALNELRWYENAPLKLKISALPAVYAAQGQTGIISSLDYRGENVLAAYTYIPEMGWGFVCKQDLYELNAPIRLLIWNFIFIFILSGIAISFIATSISKSISKPIVVMDKVAQSLKAGNFKARNMIITNDELGALATEFNNMADAIESKLIVHTGMADISETMIGKASLKDFVSSLLTQLMKNTGANMSTFYTLNDSTSEFEIFTSVGANETMLKPFKSNKPEGEFGNVLFSKSIHHLKNIPDDTIFRYKTIAGEIIPKEIISIPVVVEDNVVSIISLVKIDQFSKEAFEMIQNSWSAINVSYANFMANEQMKILAGHLTATNQQLEAQSEELQDQAEELQQQSEELRHSSEELQIQNLELEMQRQQVETANQLKSEFLSNMSHELRTPLNSIMALSRVLIMQAKDKLDSEENSYLEIVERNGKRLLSLINDILDLSKIEAGKMEVFPKKTPLGVLLKNVIENMQSLSDEKGLGLHLHIPDNLPQVETEESKLHQVLTNILGNSIKFTEKGKIDVVVKNNSESVFIEVKDSGIGISKEMLPHIFDEFRQADGTSSRKYQGTGLGLSIAKKLLTILGGKITVDSELGKGSVFTIELPIKFHAVIHPDHYATPVPEMQIPGAKTILVVDDDPGMVERISAFLYESGYKTITANSGKEAIEMAEKYRPFAITLDIIMPSMDGWEVLQVLKNKPATKDIPVIVISISDDRDTGFALGAIGYVNKPVDRHLLISEIRKIKFMPDTVMIVDDNRIELNHMAKVLHAEKINTILAENGKQCLEMLKTNIPDILVLDLMMPETDGFTVLKKIRREPETMNLPVIVVTAKDLTQEEKIELNDKVISVITKNDSTPRILFNEIKRIIIELERVDNEKVLRGENDKPRILLVEDNVDAIVQLKSVLAKSGYTVDVAEGGKEALEYVKQHIPDGIILDLMMPDIDGFEVLENIRSTNRTRKIPVLILTAKDLTKSDLQKLSANNIQQLIQKGDIDVEGLLLKVKMMLGFDQISVFEDRTNQEESEQNSPQEIKERPAIETRVNRTNYADAEDGHNTLPHILVIEDNPDNMITMKAILKGKYNIAEAYDGKEGLEIAMSDIPDLILLDMSLPVIGGSDVIYKLKSNDETKHIPVIAVTAQAMKGDSERFINMGCDSYISKPVDPALLTEEIRKLLS